jgi:adenylosuccinate synthase
MAEIRLRDVQPDFIKKLEAIQKDLKEKTATGTLERLVEGYANNQNFIKQLSARNTDLHKKLTRYYQLEETMKDSLSDHIANLQMQINDGKKLMKFFGKKPGTKRNQARKR